MRRTFFWLFVILTAFTFGVAATLTWLHHQNLSNKKMETSASDETPILAYCELANNPDKYDGKVVRVSAKLWFFIHGFKFVDKNCYANEKETAVIFDPEHNNEIIAKLTKETNSKEYGYWGMPQIIAVGRFSRIKPTGESDAMIDNAYLKFEILNVEKASEQQ